MRRNEPFDHVHTLFDLGVLFLQASRLLAEPLKSDGYWFYGCVGGSIEDAWDRLPDGATETTEHYIDCLQQVMRQFRKLETRQKANLEHARVKLGCDNALLNAVNKAQP